VSKETYYNVKRDLHAPRAHAHGRAYVTDVDSLAGLGLQCHAANGTLTQFSAFMLAMVDDALPYLLHHRLLLFQLLQRVVLEKRKAQGREEGKRPRETENSVQEWICVGSRH